MAARIRAAFLRLPRFARDFVKDAIEGAVAAWIGTTVFLPATISEAWGQLLVFAMAAYLPIVTAARRHILPAIIRAWLALTAPGPGEP